MGRSHGHRGLNTRWLSATIRSRAGPPQPHPGGPEGNRRRSRSSSAVCATECKKVTFLRVPARKALHSFLMANLMMCRHVEPRIHLCGNHCRRYLTGGANDPTEIVCTGRSSGGRHRRHGKLGLLLRKTASFQNRLAGATIGLSLGAAPLPGL